MNPNITFGDDFKDLVQCALAETERFYYSYNREEVPNPYYIGKGNPNAKILIIGKELAFDLSDRKKSTHLKDESVENPEQWSRIIEKGRFEKEFAPSYPYDGQTPIRAGSTWNKYEKLYRLIDPKFCVAPEENFHRNFFCTELNTIPSKLSPGTGKINFENRKENRKAFFRRNRFFQNFNVVVLGLNNYLQSQEIMEPFDVKLFDASQNIPNQKLVLYSNPNTKKLVIHTRQLSMDTSGALLTRIAASINGWPTDLLSS